MPSTTSRGNYYKKKSKDYYEKLGYTTQITEFMCGRQVAPNKIIYVKKDVYGSDGISMNGQEIIFWNSKHYTTDKSRSDQIRAARKEFERFPFPPTVKRHIIMWALKKPPEIIEME